MTIYLDDSYRCHTKAAEGRAPVEADVFDGKCAAYIEGMRYVPEGGTWTREDGVQFSGPMLTPAVDSRIIDAAQRVYDELSPVIDDLLVATLGV